MRLAEEVKKAPSSQNVTKNLNFFPEKLIEGDAQVV